MENFFSASMLELQGHLQSCSPSSAISGYFVRRQDRVHRGELWTSVSKRSFDIALSKYNLVVNGIFKTTETKAFLGIT